LEFRRVLFRSIIGTTFSIVSITFTLVIIDKLALTPKFLPFYFTIVVAGFIAALIMPRIPPLSKKEDKFIDPTKGKLDESITNGYNTFSYEYEKALKRGQQEKRSQQFISEGGRYVSDMWMGVPPVVMAFGLIALLVAEYTSFFLWLGIPCMPVLEGMQVPEAKEASRTI